jgi:hypothetical protein
MPREPATGHTKTTETGGVFSQLLLKLGKFEWLISSRFHPELIDFAFDASPIIPKPAGSNPRHPTA